MTIDTACSASLVALDVACKYILTGEINTAIVGATHLYLRSVIPSVEGMFSLLIAEL